MTKSPWGAVLRSAIFPGLGQFYNESYWKIPIVWGALGYLGYLWNDSNNNYKKYRDLFSANNNQIYLNLREHYKDQRDLNAVFIGLTYFLNLVDAYVDAHLFDFDVSEDFNSNKINLSVKIRF
jgi:TM2 domain-containing membrane protein YozV